MRNIFLIAKREYLEQVRGRAFKMTTIGVPAIFGLIVFVGYISSLGLGSGKHLAVASSDPALANEIRAHIIGDKDAKARVDVIAPATPTDRANLVSQVQAKSIDGILWVDTPQGAAPTATYTSPSSGDFVTTGRLKSAVNHALLDARLTGGGMNHADADALVDGVSLKTYQVKILPGRDWTDVPDNVKLKLTKDKNELIFRSVNLAGVTGPEHRLIIQAKQ